MKLKDKILIYIIHKMTVLEEDKRTLSEMRYKQPMDSLDYYEAMRADVRIQCFKEFTDELYEIVINCK